MRILLIRHAESENNLKLGLDPAEYQASRSADPGITEKGKAQVQQKVECSL
jgi:broad specificity phosphatase PhoE